MLTRKTVLLHITDLHIGKPAGSDEVLNAGYYKEYVNQLLECIKKSGIDTIDGVVVTGDFIDRGQHTNYDHAREVLGFLANQLGLALRQFCICMGNHDYPYKKELEYVADALPAGYDARKHYKEFEAVMANHHTSSERVNDVARITRLNDDVYFLALDSTNRKGLPTPGHLSRAEEDAIVNYVDDDLKVPPGKLLIIGCHYPCENFSGQLAIPQEHYWTEGERLRKRLSDISIRKDEVTLWLFGDIHKPRHVTYNGQTYIATGRFGYRSTDDTKQNRMAQVIVYEPGSKVPQVLTYEHRTDEHVDDSRAGNWRHIGDLDWSGVHTPTVPASIDALEQEAAKAKELLKSTAVVISTELEEIIEDAVVKERLYKLGSYRLSEESVALGWIHVNRLMGSGTLSNRIVTESLSWLTRHGMFDNSPAEVLIVGVDFVGAVIASQLSVRSGAINYCIASRAGGHYHTDLENYSPEEIHRFLDPIKKIVLIADVVSTGSSLAALHSQITDEVKLFDGKEIEWYALSVFGHDKSIIPEAMKFLSAFGVCCKSIPLPVHPADDFPSSRLVEPMLDLRRSGETKVRPPAPA